MKDICYFFVKLSVGRTLGLMLLIWIVLMIYFLKHASSEKVVDKIYNFVMSPIACFILSVAILCGVNGVTAKLNPQKDYGICYKVEASRNYVPDVAVLCTKEGYTKDKFGRPLFRNYPDYYEYCERTQNYDEKDYEYSDEEISQMALDYCNTHSLNLDGSPVATTTDIVRDPGGHVTITLLDNTKRVVDVYEIDGDELEGTNSHYEKIILGDSYE